VDRRSREGHATACLREEEDKDDFVKSPLGFEGFRGN
jgi:hypothetical protein